MPFHVWIVWGQNSTVADNDNPVSQYTFDTEKELAAFLDGVECASGWLEYSAFDTEKEAKDHVEDVKAEYSNEEEIA